MRYFCHNGQRTGTVYHEFFKGEWKDGDGFWNDGSICLHDDLFSGSGFERILKEALSDYDRYSGTLIYPEDWEEVCRLAKKAGGTAGDIVDEAALWVEDAFENCGCFTILGL
ncbi:hypothetical protein [Ruminococcus sp.]|uniref:hypothetical protein n=1 Tax=Ruminococcus sp. TaxID=41978 RepID=UPI0025EE00F2|nr:hypothetical protein [Ruminococcus sp.]MBQ8965472.1 hypothetical protein [Ruminococcus sp.]